MTIDWMMEHINGCTGHGRRDGRPMNHFLTHQNYYFNSVISTTLIYLRLSIGGDLRKLKFWCP